MSDRPGACAVDPRQRRGDAVDVLRCLGTLWGRASFFRMPVSIGLVRGLTIEPLKELPFGFPCARVWLKGQFDLTLYWDPNSIPDVGNQGPMVTLPARKRLFSGAGITVMPLKQAEPLVSPGPWDLDLTDGQFAVPPFWQRGVVVAVVSMKKEGRPQLSRANPKLRLEGTQCLDMGNAYSVLSAREDRAAKK